MIAVKETRKRDVDMKIKAVLFDMDGVLFDTERMSSQILDKMGAEMGYGKMSVVKPYIIGIRSENMRPIYTRFFGEDFPFDSFIRQYRARQNEEVRAHGVPVKPGLYRLLEYLKKEGYKIAVASSSHRERVLRYFRMANIRSCFDGIVCGDMVGNGKPAPEIYLTAAGTVGTPPQECLVVEDSPSGCEAGWRAGARVVMVPDLVQPDERVRAMLYDCVDSLDGVIPVLERLNGARQA